MIFMANVIRRLVSMTNSKQRKDTNQTICINFSIRHDFNTSAHYTSWIGVPCFKNSLRQHMASSHSCVVLTQFPFPCCSSQHIFFHISVLKSLATCGNLWWKCPIDLQGLLFKILRIVSFEDSILISHSSCLYVFNPSSTVAA